MPILSPETRQQTIDLLTAHLDSPATRRTTVHRAFTGTDLLPQVDAVDGATALTVPPIVDRAAAYGEVAPGTPALVALLHALRETVGGDVQASIDALVTTIRAELHAAKDHKTVLPKLFLSYARADDEAFTHRLYDALTARGFDVWFDRESMPNRALTFLDEIRTAIEQRHRLLLVVGDAALTSEYVEAEWRHALDHCKPVLPLLRVGEHGSLPKDLSQYHAPDCRDDAKFDAVLDEIERLCKTETAHLGDRVGVPPLPLGYIRRETYLDPLLDAVTDHTTSTVAITSKPQVSAVHGVGGVGKTVLASAVARECRVRYAYPDGVFWLEMGREANPVGRMGDVGAHFGDDREHYQDIEGSRLRLSHLLRDKSVLLILDDIWDHRHAEPFRFAASDRSRVLVTTRSRDIAFKLDATENTVAVLTVEEGRRLIAARQREEVSPDDLPPECDDIVQTLGGHTLAVSLAAAQLVKKGLDYAPKLSEQLRKRIEGNNPFSDLQLDDEDKNFNVEASLSLSYEDLSRDLQKRFRALGVVTPDSVIDIAMAAALWHESSDDDEEADEDDAEYDLDDLTDASLLERRESYGSYSQHVLLRAYARALLQREDDLDAAFFRYCDYVTEQAEQFDKLPLDEWGELDNLMPHVDGVGEGLMLRWSSSEDDDTLANRIGDFVEFVYSYVHHRPLMIENLEGRVRRGLDWLKAGLAVYEKQGNKSLQSLLLNELGQTYRGVGDNKKALDYYQRALTINRVTGNRLGEARVLSNTGLSYNALGERQKALHYYQQALTIKRATGDREGEGNTLTNVGEVYRMLGDNQKALDYAEQALKIQREVGNRTVQATILINIGLIYNALGERQKALDYYQQALTIKHTVGDRAGEAVTLTNMASVYNTLGERQKALDYNEQALSIHRDVGNLKDEATTLNNIGLVYNALGEQQKALDYYKQALTIKRTIGDRAGEAVTLTNMASVYNTLGERQKALDYSEQALPIHRDVGNLKDEATTLNNIGLVYNALGEQQKALDYYKQALTIKRTVGDRAGEANTLHNIGSVYNALGEQQKALDYYKQALTIQRAIDNRAGEANTLHNIGSVYSVLGENQKALDYFTQALPIMRAVGDRSSESVALWYIGHVYKALNDVDRAIEYVEHSAVLGEQIQHYALDQIRAFLEELKRERDNNAG